MFSIIFFFLFHIVGGGGGDKLFLVLLEMMMYVLMEMEMLVEMPWQLMKVLMHGIVGGELIGVEVAVALPLIWGPCHCRNYHRGMIKPCCRRYNIIQ